MAKLDVTYRRGWSYFSIEVLWTIKYYVLPDLDSISIYKLLCAVVVEAILVRSFGWQYLILSA